MSWRQKIRSTSNAELDVFIELQRRGLTTHLETGKGFKFDPEVDGVHGTTIDFYWNLPHLYAAFLDGNKVHRGRQMDKDELITEALERKGLRVDRFRYRVPLSKRRRTEICDRIERVLRSI